MLVSSLANLSPTLMKLNMKLDHPNNQGQDQYLEDLDHYKDNSTFSAQNNKREG